MSHCSPPVAPISNLSATLTIALAGNPNSGKTTIFNGLTGLRQKVANYPGVTVEKKTGRCKLPDGRTINVIDLPGTYSLISRSLDEHLAMSVLRGLRDDTPAPDVVVVVVDASNLQRNLYLVSQLIELGRPMVVALNMTDVAERRGVRVDAEELQRQLNVPVIPIVGHKKRGIDELKRAIANAKIAPLPDWPLPPSMRDELQFIARELEQLDSRNPSRPFRAGSSAALAERLLIGDVSPEIESLASREPIAANLARSRERLHALGIDPMQADVEAHYLWIEQIATAATRSVSGLGVSPARTGEASDVADAMARGRDAHATVLEYAPQRHLSEKVDAILIHKFWGLLIFAVIMGALFVSIFFLAKPIMDGLSHAIDWLGDAVVSHIGEGPIHDLLKDGIFAGVGAVVVFVPQIALLFLFLAIMEDSGYLARAAFLMDRLLSKVGLHGKSFIPLLSSFACAIPGIMATRTIESRRDRLATIFIAPFMSCSARLPVYTLLIGTFFATFSAAARGGIMLALYALGILAAVGTAYVFKLGGKKQLAQSFILELPTYKVPQWSQVLRQVWTNSWAFLAKAGTTIFCLSVILWAMMYYPRLPDTQVATIKSRLVASGNPQFDTQSVLHSDGNVTVENGEDAIQQVIASEQLRHSIAGRIGHVIEPVIKPLGFDWKMGVGLVGAFAAREVFVSTMGIVYSVGQVEDDTHDLAATMQGDTNADGKKVWTPLVAVSLLVWFVIAMQCMSTLAIVKRETGGWKWPLIMLVYMNALAYVLCLGVYQIGRIWWA